ncbi:hypothetical protein Pcinc_007084 [Petrolisthes cinctipes]|uniref:Regulatory protein zeste n=1 Tax=Petrolisthes cinctipes TaxID=88211 RepID=A0AAE1KXR5_PETCI|nr:hypothetical protein Pcinc_007084 [Petrolisthes cinctipes]
MSHYTRERDTGLEGPSLEEDRLDSVQNYATSHQDPIFLIMKCNKHDKGAPLTTEQKRCLVELIQKHPPILDKNSDHRSILRKQTAWDEVTQQYNRIFPLAQQKTDRQLKRAWEYIKIKARKAEAMCIGSKYNDETNDTLPLSPPKPDKLTLMVMELIWNELNPAITTSNTEDVETYLECTTNLEEREGQVVLDCEVKEEIIDDYAVADSPLPQQEMSPSRDSRSATNDPATSSSTAHTSSTNNASIPAAASSNTANNLNHSSTFHANTSNTEEQGDKVFSNHTALHPETFGELSDDEYSNGPDNENPTTRKRKAETESEMESKRLRAEEESRFKARLGSCFERELVRVSNKTVDVLDTLKNVIEMVGQAMVRNLDKIGDKYGNK